MQGSCIEGRYVFKEVIDLSKLSFGPSLISTIESWSPFRCLFRNEWLGAMPLGKLVTYLDV